MLDIEKLRVQRPQKFIFLCGGGLDEHAVAPPSVREAFLRRLPDRKKFFDHTILLAETVDAFYVDSPYKNLIKFEIDIAEISDSVVLFSEGYGSLAELGAFSQINTVADRIIIVIQSYHYNSKSFIKDGPVLDLEQRNAETIQVYDWHEEDGYKNKGISQPIFDGNFNDIKGSIESRLRNIPKSESFDKSNLAHKIILVSVVVHFLGAATHTDIGKAFQNMSVELTEQELRRAIFCSRAASWIRMEKRGNQKYYLPLFTEQPCDVAYKTAAKNKDTMRWKRDIRAFWKLKDERRFKLITELMPGGAT